MVVPAGRPKVETPNCCPVSPGDVISTRSIYPDNSDGNGRLSTTPASTSPIAFEGDRRVASGVISAWSRGRPRRRSPGARIRPFRVRLLSGPVEIDFRGSVDERLRDCPTLRTPSPRKTSLSPLPAVPEGQSWAWSRGRSRCCRATGNGWLSNRAARPSRCAGWLMKARANKVVKDRVRQGREAAYRFIAAMGENKPHYVKPAGTVRGHAERFQAWMAAWPADVRDHARRLAATAFERPAMPAVAVDRAEVNG